MAWAISTNDLARIGSFTAAEKHWNEEKEWKTEHASFRPLAGRRKRHMYMAKLSEGGYECVLYHTPVVTYYPDGTVKLMTYDSQSTQLFAWDMRPPGCVPTGCRGRMYWGVTTPNGQHYQQATMVLAPTDKPGSWTVTNPGEPDKEWVLDRKKAAEVRRIIKPYGDWLALTDRLTGKQRNVHNTFYAGCYVIEEFLAEPGNHENYPGYAHNLGHPERFRRLAYEVYGARTKQPVPYDRLPREIA